MKYLKLTIIRFASWAWLPSLQTSPEKSTQSFLLVLQVCTALPRMLPMNWWTNVYNSYSYKYFMVLVQFLTQYILMLVTPKSILNYAVYHYLVTLLLALTWYPWLQKAEHGCTSRIYWAVCWDLMLRTSTPTTTTSISIEIENAVQQNIFFTLFFSI